MGGASVEEAEEFEREPFVADDYFELIATLPSNSSAAASAASATIVTPPSSSAASTPTTTARVLGASGSSSDAATSHVEEMNEEETTASASASSASSSAAAASGATPALSDVLFNNGYYQRFFREVRKLGSGSFGGVYLAHHALDGIELGTYALKRIPVGDSRPWLKKVTHSTFTPTHPLPLPCEVWSHTVPIGAMLWCVVVLCRC